MATKRTKNDDERLDEAHIERVIAGLAQEKPITKKEACQILNIAYNTTRLGQILEKYKDKKEKDAARRAALRGKPATTEEVIYVIQEYLEGATVDAITKSTYRPANFIKHILEKYDVPIRQTSQNYFKPELVPEGAMRDRFQIGEVVYSARYDSIARIDAEQAHPKYGWIYRVWLLAEKWKQSAYQEAYELASLEHLRKVGVRV